MSRFLDRSLGALNWPVALVALFALPATALATWRLVRFIFDVPQPILPFLAGFTVYLIAWRVLLRSPLLGSFVSTFEHELTHALFAWLTLHKVTGLRASWSKGGEMRYLGQGNWLITIAPYFFPTFSAFLVVLLAWVPSGYQRMASAVLGVTVAYHMTSTWRETHLRQPDLQKVTFPFALAFLPTANLVCYGMILAFSHGGLDRLRSYLGSIGLLARGTLERILALLGAG